VSAGLSSRPPGRGFLCRFRSRRGGLSPGRRAPLAASLLLLLGLFDLQHCPARAGGAARAGTTNPPPLEANARDGSGGGGDAASRADRPGIQWRDHWHELQRLLGTAGVDVERFVARFGGAPAGQGGPFIAYDPRRRGPAAGQVSPEAVDRMMQSLPLAPPLVEYQVESRFGVRHDPFNHQKSLHTGLDLAAPFRSPVYATAPGRVTFAGGKGEYGRVVEIDHGSGIVTRYAHLHRISVVLGEEISGGQQIGLLGSTGRSSGPHVHYEILVNGAPQDPERFLKLGSLAMLPASGAER